MLFHSCGKEHLDEPHSMQTAPNHSNYRQERNEKSKLSLFIQSAVVWCKIDAKVRVGKGGTEGFPGTNIRLGGGRRSHLGDFFCCGFDGSKVVS